jgi:hypothetical protein
MTNHVGGTFRPESSCSQERSSTDFDFPIALIPELAVPKNLAKADRGFNPENCG